MNKYGWLEYLQTSKHHNLNQETKPAPGIWGRNYSKPVSEMLGHMLGGERRRNENTS